LNLGSSFVVYRDDGNFLTRTLVVLLASYPSILDVTAASS
jgi:hypothetical protein